MVGIISALVGKIRFRRDPISAARRLGVRIGDNCRFFGVTAATFGSEPYLVSMGDRVTVTGDGTRFITHDGGVDVLRENHPGIDLVAPIRLGSRVFVGYNAIILPGVTIGDDVVIGAGSIVTKSFPEGGVVLAGVPARPLKSIEEYRRNVLANAIPTKGLNAEQKRAELMLRFARTTIDPTR